MLLRTRIKRKTSSTKSHKKEFLNFKNKQLDTLFEIGEQLYQNKRYEDSLTFFNKLVKHTNHKNSRAYSKRGRSFWRLQLFEECFQDCKRSLKLNETNGEAYCYLANVCYEHFDNPDESFRLYYLSIQNDKTYANTYYNRGYLYHKLGHEDEAMSDYTRAIELCAHDSAYYNRAKLYSKKEMYDEAVSDYTSAISAVPDKIQALFNRANLYAYKVNEYDLAINDYSKVIDLDNDDTISYYNRGVLYGKKRMYLKSFMDLKKVMELEKNNNDSNDSHYWKAVEQLSVLYFSTGLFEVLKKHKNKYSTINKDIIPITRNNLFITDDFIYKSINDTCNIL